MRKKIYAMVSLFKRELLEMLKDHFSPFWAIWNRSTDMIQLLAKLMLSQWQKLLMLLQQLRIIEQKLPQNQKHQEFSD